MTTWITSDTHFGHKNITGPKVSTWEDGYRIFDSIREMDETMLENINSVVKSSDELIHLGDFAFGGSDVYDKYAKRIYCKNIHFLRGNHDKLSNYDLKGIFTSVDSYREYRYNGNFIVLCHYAMLTWNKAHRGSFMLHGHSHGSLKYPFVQRIKDVGVDTNNYKPYNLEEVISELSKIECFSPDHHVTN